MNPAIPELIHYPPPRGCVKAEMIRTEFVARFLQFHQAGERVK